MNALPFDHLAPPRLPSDAELIIPRGADPESSIIGPVAGRYDLDERIARGGMGIVYRAHDRQLNRTVAVKVMRGKYMDRPDLLRRFVAEARISGRLQHPGIVPVYEVGILSDARPFIAMKLIEGQTLSKHLRERTSPAENQVHYLKVFEALCHTMAYAHKERVIHRDLKPDNVMVGAFSEVQVMDWGLAKFLDPSDAIATTPDGFDAIEKSAYLSNHSRDGHTPVGEYQTQAMAVVAVGPDTPGVGYTTAGEVFGTLAYMPPEQARGEMELVDRRGDVFALGAILCQILTSQPPYFGPPETLREQAREGKLFGAYLLLDRCGAEQSIILLAKHCLAVDPEARPADAGVLAGMVTECLEGLQDRTKEIEVTRVKMEARLSEAEARERLARQARRLARMLAVAGVMVAAMLATGLGWYANDRIARNQAEDHRRVLAIQQIDEALAEADRFDRKAHDVSNTPHERDLAARQAAAASQRAEALLSTSSNIPEELRGRHEAMRTRLTETDRGTRLAMALENWRVQTFDTIGKFDPEAAAKACRETLSQNGFEALTREPAIVAAEIKAHPAGASIRELLLDWLAVTPDATERSGLVNVITLTGNPPSPGWLQALASGEIEDFAKLSEPANDAFIPATGLALAGKRLLEAGRKAEAERLFQRGVRRFPNNFALNAQLGMILRGRSDGKSEAIRYLTAARAARANDATVNFELGSALADVGRKDEAIELLKDLGLANPKSVGAHARLAILHEANGDIEAARQSYQKIIEIEPQDANAHLGLARIELAKGNLDAAEAAFQAAAKPSPSAATHAGLGRIHLKRWEATKGIASFRQAVDAAPSNLDYRLGLIDAHRIANDSKAAILEAREATRIAPASAVAQRLLGELLKTSGDHIASIAAYRAAAKADPTDADIHLRLAVLYETVDDLAAAADAYRAASSLKPGDTNIAKNLARVMAKKVDPMSAAEGYRATLKLDPGNVAVRRKLARLLADRGDEAAIDEGKKAVESDPISGESQADLGETLLQFGKFRAAATAFREAAERLPVENVRHESSRVLARNASRWAGLENRLPEILSGAATASAPGAWADFGEVCRRTKRFAAAAKFFKLATDGDAKYALSAAICEALAGFGQGIDTKELSDDQRVELRRSALEKLKASPVWASDTALANLKSAEAIHSLPESEREAWKSLWSNVPK